MNCSNCSKLVLEKKDKRGTIRLPRGWKRLGDAITCPECLGKKYLRRAFALFVASPIGLEWKALNEILSQAWGLSTGLANWTVTALAKLDLVRTPDMTRLTPCPAPYLYPLARKCWPQLSPQAVVCILNSVARKYAKRRVEAIWRSEASLPRYRYPMPYPVNSQNWQARYLSEGEKVPILSVPVGAQRVELRLSSGARFRRQLKMFGQIVSGEAEGTELAIDRQRDSFSDHRGGMVGRLRQGKETVHWRIRVTFTGWFPRQAQAEGDKVMRLFTGKDFFLKAEVPGRADWLLHCDHLESWIAAHSEFLSHMGDDWKYEGRQIKDRISAMLDAYQRKCLAQANRIKSFCQERSANVINLALRQRCRQIIYDNRTRKFSTFPWNELDRLLMEKADAAGIELDFASGETPEETGEPLAETEIL